MATYGLSHTVNTKVGDNFIRGVSGGERKRVSIAEASLCGANLQCWDNATRGLDAATALEFVRALKTSAHILDTTPLIAIYQCSQDAYDLFDNVVLLYEGYQIYFGPGDRAKDFFERMGYECPDRQTTADFLTSITSPAERVAKKGWENKVPQTPKEFSDYWRASAEYKELVADIDEYLSHCHNNNTREEFAEAHAIKQANHARPSSSFRVSYWMQIKLIAQRNIWRTKGDPSIMMFSVIANIIMGLIISSLFYNLSATTGTFYYRSAAMFFAVLFNAFSSLLEIMSLFESRPIVEKHKMFALYHPSADAFASIFTELVPKILTSIGFNLIYYFMVNFRRNPGRFFFYFLMNFMATLVMSHIFRSIGACFKTLSESMPPATVFLTAMVIYTGFALPTPSMHGWSRWINYLDPVAYVFEALMANEFDGRRFECSQFIPSYPNADLANQVCSVVASVPGFSYVNGTDYIYESYRYKITHKWRNFGITLGFIIFFLFVYVTLVELNKGAMQKGEIILFQQSKLREMRKEKKSKQISDIEGGSEKPAGVYDHGNEDSEDGVNNLTVGSDIFHWRDVCYEVQIKDETRRILNHVDGWVKPGTLTALMGASGAGKTTLLDVLANRVTMGVVSGSMFVNGRLRDQSFQRSTGYVQQQDLHLQTSTVREALRFSAYLRQSRTISKKEKDEYVESIIDILEMRSYADAVVGVAGEGLNVEQRKRLTIGVELAAKPKLLLFLDEPTSGLDSQTAWSVCQLMRKLADHGQAILCTIHQPSALLLKEFDRLLFLAKGGRTVYFGDLGENCQTLINYFESHGAHPCPAEANPAEWMLEVIGAAPGSHANQDYHEVWMSSDERRAVQEELHRMETELLQIPVDDSAEAKRSFASSYLIQYICVTKRVLEQYYRTPQYVWSKVFLAVTNSLFNGFSFYRAGTSLQGLQNQMLSIFMLSVMLNTLVQQMLPLYITQRSIYEVRERPSKTFSWWVFLAAQVTAEFPWNLICGTISYFCWYYPIGLQNNASVTHTTAERGALTWLLIVGFFNYASSLGLMCIAGVEQEQNGANISNLLFTMCLNFCGILKYPTGFWKFMYRANPFTFWIASVLGAGVGDTPLVCSSKEIVYFAPPKGETCTTYIQPYIDEAGGYLVDSEREGYCGFCTASNTNAYLKSVHVEYSKRWQNWGIFICFIAINNIFMFLFYWLARVPKKDNRVEDASALKSDEKAPLVKFNMETISVGKESDVSSDGNVAYGGFNEGTNKQIRDLAREFTRQTSVGDGVQDSDDATDSNEVEKFGVDHASPNSPPKSNQYDLLRTLTSMSQVPGVNPVDQTIDPRLDPNSDEFESKFWVKNMRKLLDSDPDYYRPTSLGFAAKNLIAKGISSDADYQANFLNYPFKVVRDTYMDLFRGNDESRYFEILKSMDVLIKPGTLTVVLGRPGAGCSTFLKTVAAQTYGFKVDDSSIISYDGLTPKEINKNYRGEVIFSAEMDNHFPHLSVGQTLEFAAKMRTPQNRFPGVSRNEYAKHMSEVRIKL
ncbi:Multidrug resistance protein CDR1 [Pichia kudriavzevii]|uniref:Multidrug resistance protein CDR1 n=2 Tax=Pichia kudriavzevii TaxID=4909 RepID=A0A1V2LPK2_PICKU|nr:Multidrug resistance protein CDR1 [Pichia kudriavzevii]